MFKEVDEYKRITKENPDLEYFLSTKEILEHVLKIPHRTALRVSAHVKATRHPPLPYALVAPNLTVSESLHIWGRHTSKAHGTPSSLNTQKELAQWWRERRKGIREKYNIPPNPRADEPARKEKPENPLAGQYRSILDQHPDALQHLSSREILQGLLPRKPQQADIYQIRHIGFRRHPMNPHFLMNHDLRKRDLCKIWRQESVEGKAGTSKNPITLLLEEEKAQKWRARREELAEKLGITLVQPQPPTILQGLNLETVSLKTMGGMLGVSEERARQIRNKFGLPKQKRKKALNVEWIKNHAHNIETYELKELEEILQIPTAQITALLRKLGIISKRHYFHKGNLRLTNEDLIKIYQISPQQVSKARKTTGITPEPYHPSYAQWITAEKERAAQQRKLHKFMLFPKSKTVFPEDLDWTQSLSQMAKETGISKTQLQKERAKRGVKSDPLKWKSQNPITGKRMPLKNSIISKTLEFLREKPERINLTPKEIAAELGADVPHEHVQNTVCKILTRKDMPKVIELIKPTLQILAGGARDGEDLKNLLAFQMKISRGLLRKKLPKSKTSRFANMTHHCRATLTRGGYLCKKGNILHLTPKGEKLQKSWDDKNPPTIADLIKIK